VTLLPKSQGLVVAVVVWRDPSGATVTLVSLPGGGVTTGGGVVVVVVVVVLPSAFTVEFE